MGPRHLRLRGEFFDEVINDWRIFFVRSLRVDEFAFDARLVESFRKFSPKV